ncbi:thaumatin-like protein [Seminavis robusta]|uniref:Thaumatin-like protein n=1 Tax=Seminavis robusta TaxID=568900 RepID=A0A9N8E712_9STRA|nr:thaumatin-like protein [Seminavis robusta]|eukprot:Sro564_g167300.1 thaumatin-like protein (282) ;mRNA; r:14720-15642
MQARAHLHQHQHLTSHRPSKASPSTSPSSSPSANPSTNPSTIPSTAPSSSPSTMPSTNPSANPSPEPFPPTQVVGFRLIDADKVGAAAVIRDIDTPSDTLSLGLLPPNLSIRADTNPPNVDGVVFVVDGAVYKTEYCIPFSLGSNFACAGENSAYKIVHWLRNPGVVTISARPFWLGEDNVMIFGTNLQTTLTIEAAPSSAPSRAPSIAPTDPPTEPPTDAPSSSPSRAPSIAPTDPPTEPPTDAPSSSPSRAPSIAPTDPPTNPPTTLLEGVGGGAGGVP